MKVSAVKASELGNNCWLPVRFCGGRCQRVMKCEYPEKKSCKAVISEIAYLQEKARADKAKVQKKIQQLITEGLK